MATILYAHTEPGQDGGTWYCLTHPAMYHGDDGHGETRYFRTEGNRLAAVDRFESACKEAGLFPLVIEA